MRNLLIFSGLAALAGFVIWLFIAAAGRVNLRAEEPLKKRREFDSQ